MNSKISKVVAGLLLGAMVTYTLPVAAFTKDETVYTNLKSDGEKYKTVVTEHLINEEDEEILKDLTDLLNIENTSGDEEFNQDSESITWSADSNDIYYKGETDKELPVDMNVKYELDGEEIDADSIAGKSGKVKITIEFTNKEEHNVRINGKSETMYTPFVVATGTYLQNENNKNIEVKNGKAIDDGSKTMVVGLTFPGMQESLGISESTFEIPTTIEITMDSTNFEMSNIINYATPKIIEDSDIDIFSKLDEIYDKVDTLQSASQEIENGAKTLADGTTTYVEKSSEFNSAVNQFTTGVNTVVKSYSSIDDGISSINNSTSTLTAGSKQISEGLSQVNTGVKAMSDTISDKAQSISELQTGASNLKAGLTNLNSNITVEDNQAKITAIETQMISDENTIAKLTTSNNELTALLNDATLSLSDETRTTLEKQITANNEAITNLTYDYNYLQSTVTTLKESSTKMQALKNSVTELEEGATGVSNGVDSLAENLANLGNKLSELYTNTGKLSTGASNLYNGTVKLESGANKLAQGSKQLKSGLSTINTSAQSIYDADTQLVEGAVTIQTGAAELSSGIQEFNNTGINVICNYITGDLKDVSARAEKLKELSDEYNTFTKLNDEESEGKVKFIMIVDSIKNSDDESGQEDIDEKTGE